jgi:pSer/pThr/pTyr-binding forkhead associated (FHA) protein
VLAAGKSRREIARTLSTARASGLLSEDTFLFTDTAVSRFHARLRFRGGRWILQDLESTNGTTLNGERVGRSELRAGDVIAIGTQRLTID